MKTRNPKKGVKIMLTSLFGLILVLVMVVFLASGIVSKPKYLEPWEKTYSDQFDDPRIKLAAHGMLAANGHNMQPWKIKLDTDPNVFYLYADPERLAPEVDPYARQTMITQGTFLEYVVVAGEKLGYSTEITLFPDGQYDENDLENSMATKPVAKITISKSEPQVSNLYDDMFLPDTNRAPYAKTELTPEQIQRLVAINSDIDLKLNIYQDEANKTKLGNFAIEGAKIESGIHRINEESAAIFRANEYQKNEYRYGFSVEGQGTTGIMKHVMQGLLTLFPNMNNEKSSADLFVTSTENAVNNTPAYAMIISNTNSREEQVKSGMLYSRLVLTAHSLGLVMQPPSQVLEEYPEMQEQYTAIHHEYAAEGGTIQMFFRIGTPTQEFPNSMRRDVTDLIIR